MAIDVISDEIIGRWSDTPGVRITELSGHKKDIPRDSDKNIASITATALLKHLGEERRGLELKIHKHIQGGSGLGSSASSATAAAFLVNEMLDHPLDKRALIPFAMEGEVYASGSRHGDNVVPAMMGGLVLIRDIDTFDFHRVYTPKGLYMVILLPLISIKTKTARDILHPTVPLHDMVRQAANLGALVIGMQMGDLNLISRSLEDHIIEPQRKHLIPHFDAVKEKAMSLGALGCSISGAGPAIFALCAERSLADEVAKGMKDVYDMHRMESTTYVGGIQHEGTRSM